MATPLLGFTEPQPADPPDGAAQITLLANEVDTWGGSGAALGAAYKTTEQTTTQAAGLFYDLTGLSSTALQGGFTLGVSTLVVPTSGLYRVSAFQRTRCVSAETYHAVAVRDGGGNVLGQAYAATVPAGSNVTPGFTGIYRLTAASTLALALLGNGNEVTIYATAENSGLSAEWVGP